MENRARIVMAENRRIVQDGLNRRKLEHQLDAFEDEMLQGVNEHCVEAYWQNVANVDREKCKARIVARAEQKAAADRLRKDIALACLIFFAFASVMLHLAAWTPLPIYMALLMVGFGVLFLVSFIRNPDGFPIMEDEE